MRNMITSQVKVTKLSTPIKTEIPKRLIHKILENHNSSKMLLDYPKWSLCV